MNDIKFTISAFNGDQLVYGSTLQDTASVQTVLALNDELFDEDTLFVLEAIVDTETVYISDRFKLDEIDSHFDLAELAVERVIK